MFKRIAKFSLVISVLAFVSYHSVANAAEYLIEQQIEQVTEGLNPEHYVLPTPDDGMLMNLDGSNHFLEEQLYATNSQVMTVAEFKEFLKTFDISKGPEEVQEQTHFRAAWAPSKTYVLGANGYYRSNPFSAKGWRYGEMRFYPAHGTGDYLYWQAIGDSGIVEDGAGVSVSIYPGSTVPVYSRRGTYFKTHNPVNGSHYVVTNPV